MAQQAGAHCCAGGLGVGGLYGGFFTPTEAGGVGAFGALIIALMRRSLGKGNLWRVLHETGSVSCTILILLVAASLLQPHAQCGGCAGGHQRSGA
jgi:TRAP-type C4-dicarboxylate transport system permease large subunit